MQKKYRIVKDRWNGFEVQVWVWWFPIWSMPVCNTLPTLEAAETWANEYAQTGGVVKILGWLPRKSSQQGGCGSAEGGRRLKERALRGVF